MKINLEFENADKFFSELPKFAALIGIANEFASFTYVKKGDTSPVLNPVDVKVYRDADNVVHISGASKEATDEAHDKIAKALDNGVAFVKGQQSSDEKPAESTDKASEKAEAVNSPAEEEKTETDPTETPQEASGEVKDTDVRAALNKLIKGGKRDKVSEILKEFGAKNFSGLKAKDYAAVVEKAKEAANG